MKPHHYDPAWREAIVCFPSEPCKARIRQISLATNDRVVIEVDLTTMTFLFPGEEPEEAPNVPGG